MKRENRSIDKRNLTEVTGNREELSEYVGMKMKVDAFVTNTYGYLGDKRLVTEIKIGEYFIKHAWLKSANIGNLDHGYQKIEVEITEYPDLISGETKYGFKYDGTKGKKFRDNKLVIPKWMK